MIKTERGARRQGYLSALLGAVAYMLVGASGAWTLFVVDPQGVWQVLAPFMWVATVALCLRIDLPILGEHYARRWRGRTPVLDDKTRAFWEALKAETPEYRAFQHEQREAHRRYITAMIKSALPPKGSGGSP